MLDFFMYVRIPLFYGLQPNGVRAVPNFLLRASMPNLPYFNAPGTGHIVEGLITILPWKKDNSRFSVTIQ